MYHRARSFALVAGTSHKLVDTKGREIWTVFARPITNEEQETAQYRGREAQDEVLRAMLDKPDQSLLTLAEYLEWTTVAGQPNRPRVHRVLKQLEKAKLVEQARGTGQYVLTKKGEEEAENTPKSAKKAPG